MTCFDPCRGSEYFATDRDLLSVAISRKEMDTSINLIILFGVLSVFLVLPIVMAVIFVIAHKDFKRLKTVGSMLSGAELIVCHEQIAYKESGEWISVVRSEIEELFIVRDERDRATIVTVLKDGEYKKRDILIYISDEDHLRMERFLLVNYPISPPPKRFGIGGFGGMH